MRMDLERIGSRRHRDNSHHFQAESEALDQIAKEVRVQKLTGNTLVSWLRRKWEEFSLQKDEKNQCYNLILQLRS